MKTEKILLIFFLILSLAFCASPQKRREKIEKNAQDQYEKAVIAMRYGLEDESIKYLNQALSLNPGHYQSYNLLGTAYFMKQNFKEAASAYQKCLEIKPDFSEARNNLGQTYQKMDFPDKAEEEYKKAYATDGNHTSSFNLARLYFEQDKPEPALDFIQKSIQTFNRSAISYNLQGVILNKMGRYKEALQSFQNALRIDPNDVVIFINLGIAYINIRDFNKGREILEKALPRVKDQSLKTKISEYLKMIEEAGIEE